MTKNNQDELVRAYAMLESLRKNIGEMAASNVSETYVGQFHDALDKLAGSLDTSDFRIPASELAPIRTDIPVRSAGERNTGGTYSKEKYVKKTFMLIKIDTVLRYLEIVTSEQPRRIGFTKTDE
ncbi:MAG: hypothetical protein HYX91_05180 [Chloroflexi bacterium]|nr:hypothetical protein [Chloroflexota bacterium]